MTGGVAGLRNRQGLRLLTGVTGGHVATVITDAVATVVTTRGTRLTALTRLSRLTGLAVICRRGGNLIRHVSKRSRHCHEGCTQQGCGGAGRNQRLLKFREISADEKSYVNLFYVGFVCTETFNYRRSKSSRAA